MGMMDLMTILEERTRAWSARGRQDLADSLWADYVAARFAGTGDARAMAFLYPYLNHSSRTVRGWAIKVAGRVFERCGPDAIDAIDYLTKHRDPVVRDRAVRVVGQALEGWPVDVVLREFEPYLNHRNRFIRQRAVHALLWGARGTASGKVLAEIRRVAEQAQPPQEDVDHAIANTFAGQPTEEVYTLVARPDVRTGWWGTDLAVGVLIHGAPDAWYDRACEEFFEPRLHGDPQLVSLQGAADALCFGSVGRGMPPLQRILHLRHKGPTMRALVVGRAPWASQGAASCFAGADRQANFEPLAEMIRSGDPPAKRVAAICLGKLMEGAEDAQTVSLLKDLCAAKNGAVRAAGLGGLATAARSTCDEALRGLCLQLARGPETARAAIEALGMIFQGSGRRDVFEDIRHLADHHQNRPVRGRHSYRPLAACYRAIGYLYLGTGSTEPLDVLLDVLAPSPAQRMPYLWAASRALVMIEFPESTLRRALGENYGESWH